MSANRAAVRFRFSTAAFFAFATVAALFASTLDFAAAQPPSRPARSAREHRPIPSERYYDGFELIESGNFPEAIKFYQTELKRGERIGTAQWIDSICYYTMLGETYYQAGMLVDALDNYKAALTLSLEFPNWLGRVSLTTPVGSAVKSPAPWGTGSRACPLVVFPKNAVITTGDPLTEERLKQGGIISQPESRPIDAAEILRCVALSVRRRTEILGPLSPFDPMSERVLSAYSNRSVPPNHWSIVWLDVLFGLALSQNGKPENARNVLSDALLAGGRSDHLLTAPALLELGNLYLDGGRAPEAAKCYYEASICAFNYGDRLLVEEALRKYSNAKKALDVRAADPTIAAAFAWAKTQKRPLLSASIGLELVEELIYAGKMKVATSGLAAVDATMRAPSARALRSSRAADRWNYLNALLHYSNGNIGDGDAALAKVVEGMKIRSPWALQLMRLDNYVKSGLTSNGPLTPRNAADLYDQLLREPTVVDWAYRPTESLAIQMIAPPGAYERWFQILFERDLKDKAFEVSERIRRERFYSTQTYGGRLVSLRYLLMANDALTTTSVRAARQKLLVEFPRFAELTKESKAIAAALDELPSVPRDKAGKEAQAALLARLADVSAEQEALLRLIAAGRVRIPRVFPPVLSVADVQKRLPPDTAVLAFLDAGGETFGFMIGKNNLDSWRVGTTDRVAAAVSTFLKTIGSVEGTRQVEGVELSEARWRAQGSKLREIVLGASDVDADRFNIQFSKLVVVPDSVLWYLPFEALCLPAFAAAEADADADADAENSDAETETSETAATETDAENIDDLFDAISDDETAPTETRETAATEKTTASAAPTKRKSQKAREREALDAFENSLIPMIQTPELTLRYSATVGLSLPNALGRNAFVETTLFAGSTYPKQAPETLDAALERFLKAVPKTEAARVGSLPNAPGGLYSARLKRLVVWDEIVGDVWNWEPLFPSETKRGNAVADWIYAPWGAPRLIVLPALRTRAESALENGGDGSEIFLPIIALQSTGADAILMSRWRTGGRSAFDLTADFVQNYENMPVADAWKAAVAALRERDVVLDEEPRLRKPGKSDPTPKYDVPFWWAGYLLVDSGEAVSAAELEKFDAENVKKMEAENAALGANAATNPNGAANANGTAPNANADANGTNANASPENAADSTENVSTESNDENAENPPIVIEQKSKNETPSNDETLDFGPAALDDETLENLDEAGEDFFADDENAESADAPKNETPSDDKTE